MRDAIALFERELAMRNGRSTTLESFRFVGMMEQGPESIYDLPLATPENMDSKSNFEGELPSDKRMQHVAPLRGWGSAGGGHRGQRLYDSTHPQRIGRV
jgi:hypothetical protein